MSDNPVKSGTPLVLSVDILPEEEILGGEVVVSVKVMGIAAPPFKVDLCTETGLVCPLPAGAPASAKITYKIPSYAPSSTVKAHITATDLNSASMACMDTSIKIVNGKKLPSLRGT